MADGKQVPLSIIIRTVDKATAGIQAVNKRLDAITKPTRDFGKALGELKEKSGVDAVVSGFRGVGSAIGDVIGKVAVVGGVVALAVHGVLGLVEEFDNLGDTAEKLGVTADFLSGMRFAAERSGASVEQLDQGLTTFGVNLGGVKAGTGKLVKFLGEVAPAMLTQLKATKTTEEGLLILAAGMEKLTNKSKQLKLAQAALGDPALAVLFHRGPKGIQELLTAYGKLAGPQQEAADRAGEVDDALKDLGAATTGVKAALITGLAPALKQIIERLTEWLSGHREDVARWADDIGKKLPDAVDKVVKSVTGAAKWIVGFVDDIGGWKVAALGMAAVITGPLVSSFVTLGAVLTTTPFGLVITSLAAIGLGLTDILLILSNINKIRSSKSFDAEEAAMNSGALPGGNERAPTPLESKLMASGALPKSRRFRIVEGRETAIAREADANLHKTSLADFAAAGTGSQFDFRAPPPWATGGIGFGAGQQPIKMKVEFSNAPKGTSVSTRGSDAVDIDHTVGYQMSGVW